MKLVVRSTFAGLLILITVLAAIPAAGQTSDTAIVLGTVTDPGGAVVPDATVDLTNAATNDTKTITTNSSGQYVLPNVAAGSYTLKISKPGFAIISISNIKVDVTKSYIYDVVLEIRSGKEIIEVSAQAQGGFKTVDQVFGQLFCGDTLVHPTH